MARNSFFIAAVCGLVMAAVSGPLRAGSPPPTPTATQCLNAAGVAQSDSVEGCSINYVNRAPGECELQGQCKTFWRARSEGYSEATLPAVMTGRTGCASKEEDRTATQVRFTCTTTSNRYSPDSTGEAQNCDGRLRVGSC